MKKCWNKIEYIKAIKKRGKMALNNKKWNLNENHLKLQSNRAFWMRYASSTWLLWKWKARNGRSLLSRRNYGNQEKVDAQNPFERFFMILVEDLLSTFDIVIGVSAAYYFLPYNVCIDFIF